MNNQTINKSTDQASRRESSSRRSLNESLVCAKSFTVKTAMMAIGITALLLCLSPTIIIMNGKNGDGVGARVNETLSASMGFNDGRNVPECIASFCDLERVNRETVQPLLRKIVTTPFFSHFKIDLCSPCELWDDKPLCRMKDCSVCECEEPPVWASDGVEEMPSTGPDPGCDDVADDNVVTSVDSSILNGWQDFGFDAGIESGDSGSDSSSTAQVVDLLLNPEGYTGYTGPSAEKVWSAIHSTNCFQPQQENEKSENEDEYCSLSPEQRLYNRFINGLHSSISLHIAHSYCLEMDPHKVGECYMWGLNDEIAYERVLQHPDRVENLYVAFALLLRAVVKAESAIAAAVPSSDPALADSLSQWTESLMPELLSLPEKLPNGDGAAPYARGVFDESALLSDPEFRQSKRAELQRRFSHLTDIMQCVGCDRCKLWGTLQTLGVGTALRILFHEDATDGGGASIDLSRQEAVALVNTLERLSSSLTFAHEFRARRETAELWKRNTDDASTCSSTEF